MNLHDKIFNRICRNADGGAAGGGDPSAGAAAAGTGGQGSAPPAVWTDSLQDTGLREFAVNKGYNKGAIHEVAPTILQQYHNLEKLVGADKAGNTVIKPNWDDDSETGIAQRNAFFDAVGRPKEGKDYDLAIPQGAKVNEVLDKWSRETFHKAGLSPKQATLLAKEYQAMEQQTAAEEQAAQVQTFAAEDKALKTEWGAAYADKIAKASAVAKGLGVKPEVIDALQKHAGYSDAMKMFANLADKIGEDTLINPETNNNGSAMTPAEANAELNRLSRDKDWSAAWMDKQHPNHKAAVERKAFLTSQMVVGQGA